jgi:hypothetical protein
MYYGQTLFLVMTYVYTAFVHVSYNDTHTNWLLFLQNNETYKRINKTILSF